MTLRKQTLKIARWMAHWMPQPVKQMLYRHSNLARFIRRRLNQAAPIGLTQVEIAAGEAAGLIFQLNLQSEKDYWLGTFEPEMQAALVKFVKPGMVVYDVGANIGYISLMLARCVGSSGRVVAFEALPENISRLIQNISLNNFGDRVVVVSKAVADQPGVVAFQVASSGRRGKVSGSAGRHASSYLESIQVESTSIDEIVFRESIQPPQVIKVDIEGGEVLAFPGMRNTLAVHRPLILVELHGPEAAQITWDTLISAGYRPCLMKPGFPSVPSLTSLEWRTHLVCFPPGDDA